jgi:hypothetical protein
LLSGLEKKQQFAKLQRTIFINIYEIFGFNKTVST